MATISQKTIDNILLQAHPWWHERLSDWIQDKAFEPVMLAIQRDRFQLAPTPDKIFRVLQMEPSNVRVCLVGQDPFINGEAMGLAFSSQTGLTPSAREMFKEIARTEGRLRQRPMLDDWEYQGVFLLNTNLTTVLKRSLAHDKIGWDWMTSQILQIVDQWSPHLVTMAWGNHAKKVVRANTKPHPDKLRLEWTHPAARFQEFTGNNHFRLANEHLTRYGYEPIDWAGAGATPVQQPDYGEIDSEES